MFRRLIPAAIILSLLTAAVPAPVLALSTESEVAIGRANDEQIVSSSVIETDPLLNAYVQGVADKLWKQVARKDVPYNIKIIKDNQVNAFSTLGGYVYLYEGVIDVVQSDDELAMVIAHETGHIERRHTVTMQSKAQALDLLFGIASIFSPLIYNFGNIAEAGVFAKLQRADEIQADRTGLQLMSRAGYDPDAAVTMTAHLAAFEGEHSDLITKYLQNHPEPDKRVAHLSGYPELDPKVVTEQQRVVQAVSDEERSRYSYSALKLTKILHDDPNNAEALLSLGQAQLALGETSKSAQTLAEAAQKGSPETRAQADQSIAALREIETKRVTLTKPNLQNLTEAMSNAQAMQTQAAVQIQARRDQGRDQIKQINNRLQALQYEIPDFSRVDVKHGSRLEAVLKNLNSMSRSINSALSDATESINGVGSVEKNKEGGLLKENADILKEMQAPLDLAPIPTDSIAVLPSYPSMLQQLSLADSDMVRTVDAARASLTVLDQSLGDLDEFFKDLARTRLDFSGDLTPSDYNEVTPMMQRANTSLNTAASAASQASQVYNMARSRQLSTRITLLGLGTSPQRYATLTHDLNQRFGLNGIDYETMIHDNLTPGDVVIATILAADVKSTPDTIVDQMMSAKKSAVDLANERGMHTWPLEIFAGLVYFDYTDDPVKELHSVTPDGNKSGATV